MGYGLVIQACITLSGYCLEYYLGAKDNVLASSKTLSAWSHAGDVAEDKRVKSRLPAATHLGLGRNSI